MKKVSMLLCTLFFVCSFIIPAHQTHALMVIENAGQKVVYDDRHNQYWYWDLTVFTNKTYSEQQTAIADLNTVDYFGITEWAMATYADMLELWSYTAAEVAENFKPNTDKSSVYGWEGRYDLEMAPGIHYDALQIYQKPFDNYVRWDLDGFGRSDSDRQSYISAWVVAPASSPVIPEPSTLFLLGVGLVALVSFRRKLRS